MKKILDGMHKTMNAVKPPRMTALRDLRDAEIHGPFSILIGTILSARTKDESTARVSKELFKKYKTAKQLAGAKIKDVEKIIKSIGFYHVKARRIIEVSKIIDSQYKGKVPDNLEKLVELPGVGRKTASVVLNEGFGLPTIAVDTHVFRVGNRTGLAYGKNPDEVQENLYKVVPKKYLKKAGHTLLLHGRYTCKARTPLCETCVIIKYCKYKNKILR